MAFRIVDEDGLAEELQRLSQLRFDAVIIKNMTQIYNRGKADGGTPVSTDETKPPIRGVPQPHGELRGSLAQDGDLVYYSKSYAAHVEYGHRTRGGGYVQGQRYLQKNVKAQKPIFIEDLRRELRRFK